MRVFSFVLLCGFWATSFAHGKPISLISKHAKTAFCTTLLGRTPLNPEGVVEVLIRLYPRIKVVGETNRYFNASKKLYSHSNQAHLVLLKREMREFDYILGQFFAPPPYIEKTIGEELKQSDSNAPVKTIAEAELRAKYYGIVQTESFTHLPENVRLELLNEVFQEIRKVPAQVQKTIERAGKHLDLVVGTVTNHPNLSYLRGVRPRGWPEKSVWDHVPGLSNSGFREGTVVAADSLTNGHASINLVLHEQLHTFEEAESELSGLPRLSHSTDFLDIHRRVKWTSAYEGNYPDEAFAESAARYLHSARSRQDLFDEFPEVAEYFRRLFSE